MNLPGEGTEGLVILSEAKDHLATLGPRKEILRFAQDGTWFILATMIYPVILSLGMIHPAVAHPYNRHRRIG